MRNPKIRIIYINSRSYGRDFPDENDKFFYLFGVGHFLAWEVLRIDPSVQVENWRADATININLEKEVDGIICRVFKGIHTRIAGTFSLSMIVALRTIIKKDNNFVLLHFHGLHNLGYDLITWLVPKVPIVATHHGGGNFNFKYHHKRRFKTYLAEIFDRLSMRYNFSHLFVQTETEKNYLSKIVKPEKISRITPFGFDFSVFRPIDRIEAKRKIGLDPNKTYLLSIGRADHLKGVQNVVRVFEFLKDEFSDIELICVDIQPGDLYYQQIVDSNAIIRGHIHYYELPYYYSASSVLVYLPMDDESLHFAGPGFVNAEALACGIPVVSSLLKHFWDSSINLVARIPNSVEEAKKMTREMLLFPPEPDHCREVAYKYFNWDYVMRKHIEVYNKSIVGFYGDTSDIKIAIS